MSNFSSQTSNEYNASDPSDYVFKFVIIGDSGVGKSCVIHHFIHNKCKQNTYILVKKETTQTVGVDFSSKVINISNKEVKLQLWDTAGQEKYRAMAKSYYRGAIGVIILYDITK